MKRSLVFTALVLVFAAAAQAQTRGLTVVTEPNAAVWIDGIRYGTTGADGRLVVKTVLSGNHSIKVRAAGFKEKVQPVTAAARGDVKVALTATNDKAELAFQEAEKLSSIDREKAIAAFKNAISLRPGYVDAYISLARLQGDNGDHADALATLKTLKRVKPAVAEASAVEARILKESGEEEKAIAAFKRSIAEGRGVQAEANTGLGILYKERAESAGDPEEESAAYAESAKYLKTAIRQLGTSPDAMVVYQLLGLIYEKTGRTREAIALYKDFLKLFPDSAEATAVQSFIVQLEKQL